MPHRIGDAVRMRPGMDDAPMLGEAAELVGIVGDLWTDERGDRISVVYEPVQVYAFGLPAAAFEPAPRPDEPATH